MRRLLIAMAALLTVMSCGRRLPSRPGVPGGTGTFPRAVLLEMFTATWCTNCPVADTTIERVAHELGDDAILVEYHPTSGGDPMGFAETDNRGDYYGVVAWPTLRVDGIDSAVGSTAGLYQAYRAKADNRLLVKSPIKLALTGQVNGGQFDYQVSAQADTSLRPGDLRLLVLGIEDSIAFTGPNGLPLHRWVVRKLLPNAQGTALSLSAGGTATRNGSLAFDPSWRQDRLHLVALVQDWSTKEVLQSARIDLSIPAFQFVLSAPDTIDTLPAAATAEFRFFVKNTGLMPDSVWLDLPDSLASVPLSDRALCDLRGMCYPIPFAVYLAPGDSADNLVVHMSAATAGHYRGGLSLRSVSDPALTRAINFHTEVQ
ncbi:MAG: Omp28-related outer membrane protein [Candidatus Edwardsbacteria bacterium]|jgi:thiol-disulfide isomerase/thioredoxin|nr:Omp28-related outer membrane protein [Candidatus Edwardsbacteria bacterium]